MNNNIFTPILPLIPFLKLLKELFKDKYAALSNEERIILSCFYDRHLLSVKNHWQDNEGRVYIIFTITEICEKIGCSPPTAVKILRHLEDSGLIGRKKIHQGKCDHIYLNNANDFANTPFYKLPWVFLSSKSLVGDLSSDAKVLYAILSERNELSHKNGWIDTEGRVYISFSVDDIGEILNCCNKTAIKALKELEKAGLVEKKRRGQGKTSILFIRSILEADLLVNDVEKQVEKHEKSVSSETYDYSENFSEVNEFEQDPLKEYTSVDKKTTSFDTQDFKGIKTEKNKTEKSYTYINQSISPTKPKSAYEFITTEGWDFERCIREIGVNTDIFYGEEIKSEKQLSEYSEEYRDTKLCKLPYYLKQDRKVVINALMYVSCLSYYFKSDTEESKKEAAYFQSVLDCFADLLTADHTNVSGQRIMYHRVFDKLNELIHDKYLSDFIFDFKSHWEQETKQRDIKNKRAYMRSSLWNFLNDYDMVLFADEKRIDGLIEEMYP